MSIESLKVYAQRFVIFLVTLILLGLLTLVSYQLFTVSPNLQSSTVLDSVSFETLQTHFEKVVTQILDITNFVVILAGGSGILSSYFFVGRAKELEGLREETTNLNNEIEQLRNTATKRIKDLRTEIANLQNEKQQLKNTLEEAQEKSRVATRCLRYLLEIRDRNPKVRVQAVKQLGYTNDITASILIKLLEADPNQDVQVEAAYWLGQLLIKGQEDKKWLEVIQVLHKGTEDAKDLVRLETVKALNMLILNNVQLPRATYRRMQEIIKYDLSDGVIQAAKETLENLNQQRNKLWNSQDG